MRGASRTLAVLAALGCAPSEDPGVAAYEAGRFERALELFATRERRAGDEATARQAYDVALCALRAGELQRAEDALARVLARGGEALAPAADFLLGDAAFVRARLAEREAGAPDAASRTLERAIGFARAARDAWRRAAIASDGWSAARRNAERAARLLAALDERRGRDADARPRRPPAAGEAAPAEDPGGPEPPPRPPRGVPDEDELAPPPPAAPTAELPPDEVPRLLETLARHEREKRAARRALRQTRSTEVERDW